MSTASTDLFVGREREMAELTAALENALSGRGGLVLLAGEPGIGKTRTAEELAVLAAERGAEVLWGRCSEQQGAPPMWPWSQIVRSYARTRDSETLLKAFGTGAGRVAGGIPEIGELLPGFDPPAVETGTDHALFLLFDAFASFLKTASQDRPIVIIIDNLHWADGASLKLLEFITPDLTNSSILLVGTYRDVEVSRRHPLSGMLANLNRERSFQRVPLKGLTEEEVGRLVAAGAGAEQSPEIVRALNDRSEGNPFFVQEFVNLLRWGNQPSRSATRQSTEWWNQIPEGVREVIGHRLDGLSEECNRVLAVAAVIGRAFSFDLLRRLFKDMDEDQIVNVLEEALAMRIIEEITGGLGHYQFTHALIGQTLVDELHTTRRVRIHAQIGQVLEDLYGSDAERNAGELAYHFAEAETVLGSTKVIHYSVVAGEQALTAGSRDEAEQHFRRIEASCKDRPEDELTARLYRGLGLSLLGSHERPVRQRGWDLFAQAFDLHVRLENIERALDVAETPLAFGTLRGTAELTGRALRLLDPESLRSGYLLVRHSIALRDELGDLEEDIHCLEKAMVVAKEHDDMHLEAQVMLGYGQHFSAIGDRQASIDYCQRADDLAREFDDSGLTARAVMWGMDARLGSYDSDGVVTMLKRHREIAETTRSSTTLNFSYESEFGIWRNMGEWERASLTAANDFSRTANQVMHQLRAFAIDCQRMEIGETDERVVAICAEAERFPEEVLMVATFSWLAARNETLLGLIPLLSAAIRPVFADYRLLKILADSIALLAARNTKAAANMLEKLSAFSGWWDIHGGISADHVLGMLAALCAQPDVAAGHFEKAIEMCRKAGFKPALALTCCDYAEMLAAGHHDPDLVKRTDLIDEGARIANELSMHPLIQRFDELSTRVGASSQDSRLDNPDGLSERELEVLRLLAVGMTNQNIADELFISRYTVNRHTANIYSKIDAANRAEAATYASRHNLLEDSSED